MPHLLWVSLITLLGIFSSGVFMTQPMRYDESYTFLQFVNQGVDNIFYYPLPNNHVLHTILVWIVTRVGGAIPFVIRLPAFVVGIACIPVLYALCRKLGSERSGFIASLSFAIFPYMILYATMARGYTLQVLLSLLLAYGLLCVRDELSLDGAFFLSIIGAAGLFTIPSMLFPLSGLYLWLVVLLVLDQKSPKEIFMKFLLPSGTLMIFLAGLLYTPVVAATGGLDSITNNSFVRSQPWPEFFKGICPHIPETFSIFIKDIPFSGVILGLALCLYGLLVSTKSKDKAIILLLPCLLMGSLFFLLAKHRIPFNRTWIFLIPFVLVVMDAGFAAFLKRFSVRWRTAMRGAMLGVGVLFSISLMTSDAIPRRNDTGVFPEAKAVAEYLAPLLTEDDVVDCFVPVTSPVRFYLWKNGALYPDVEGSPRKTFFVVKKSEYAIQDLTKRPTKKIFDVGDAEIHINN